jgi:5,10-methylene-tetrahydrofolate dehydrogenase/methenyl tetrahydrofolate cyclohydrolase
VAAALRKAILVRVQRRPLEEGDTLKAGTVIKDIGSKCRKTGILVGKMDLESVIDELALEVLGG